MNSALTERSMPPSVAESMRRRLVSFVARESTQRIAVISDRGLAFSWSQFRTFLIEYASTPEQTGLPERYLNAVTLNFGRYEVRLPLQSFALPQPSSDSAILRAFSPVWSSYRKLAASFSVVPSRMRFQWSRRIAVEFPWEGTILSLMKSGVPLNDLLEIPGASVQPTTVNLRAIEWNLYDDGARPSRVRAFLRDLRNGKELPPSFKTGLSFKQAERVCRQWHGRLPHLDIFQRAAEAWPSPDAFIVAAFVSLFANGKTASREKRSNRRNTLHLRFALSALPRNRGPELLMYLGEVALHLGMERTAWSLLMRSTKIVPRGRRLAIAKYQYPPHLLADLAELASKAHSSRVGNQYTTWFEERVIADALRLPESADFLTAIGIAVEE